VKLPATNIRVPAAAPALKCPAPVPRFVSPSTHAPACRSKALSPDISIKSAIRSLECALHATIARLCRSSGKCPRPDGEIGRRKRLKISRPQGHAGSIPAPGTKSFKYFHNRVLKTVGPQFCIWSAIPYFLNAAAACDELTSRVHAVRFQVRILVGRPLRHPERSFCAFNHRLAVLAKLSDNKPKFGHFIELTTRCYCESQLATAFLSNVRYGSRADIPFMTGEHSYFAKLTLPRTSRGSEGRHIAMALLAGGRGSEKSPTLTIKPFAPSKTANPSPPRERDRIRYLLLGASQLSASEGPAVLRSNTNVLLSSSRSACGSLPKSR
jgi:hypothetical protein